MKGTERVRGDESCGEAPEHEQVRVMPTPRTSYVSRTRPNGMRNYQNSGVETRSYEQEHRSCDLGHTCGRQPIAEHGRASGTRWMSTRAHSLKRPPTLSPPPWPPSVPSLQLNHTWTSTPVHATLPAEQNVYAQTPGPPSPTRTFPPYPRLPACPSPMTTTTTIHNTLPQSVVVASQAPSHVLPARHSAK